MEGKRGLETNMASVHLFAATEMSTTATQNNRVRLRSFFELLALRVSSSSPVCMCARHSQGEPRHQQLSRRAGDYTHSMTSTRPGIRNTWRSEISKRAESWHQRFSCKSNQRAEQAVATQQPKSLHPEQSWTRPERLEME